MERGCLNCLLAVWVNLSCLSQGRFSKPCFLVYVLAELSQPLPSHSSHGSRGGKLCPLVLHKAVTSKEFLLRLSSSTARL